MPIPHSPKRCTKRLSPPTSAPSTTSTASYWRWTALSLLLGSLAGPPAWAQPAASPRGEVTLDADIWPHSEGESMWASQFFSRAQADCRLPPEIKLPRPDHPVPCVWRGVQIASQSPRPMLCRVRARFAYVDKPEKVYNSDQYEVVYPGREVSMDGWQLATDRELRSLTPTCQIVPAELPLETPSACVVTERTNEAFYPPSSIYHKHEGVVVLEYSTSNDSKWISDIALLASSGHEALDRYALKSVRVTRIDKACPAQRTRRTIRFELPG